MKLIEVKSSNIKKVGWDEDGLIVEYMSGSKYRYKKVPRDMYDQFLESDSKGRFMNSNIKNKYEYERLAE